MSYQSDYMQDQYATEKEVVEIYSCDCGCNSQFISGYLDPQTNFHFSDDCVLRGWHQELYKGGDLTDLQITEIHNSFEKI